MHMEGRCNRLYHYISARISIESYEPSRSSLSSCLYELALIKWLLGVKFAQRHATERIWRMGLQEAGSYPTNFQDVSCGSYFIPLSCVFNSQCNIDICYSTLQLWQRYHDSRNRKGHFREALVSDRY